MGSRHVSVPRYLVVVVVVSSTRVVKEELRVELEETLVDMLSEEEEDEEIDRGNVESDRSRYGDRLGRQPTSH